MSLSDYIEGVDDLDSGQTPNLPDPPALVGDGPVYGPPSPVASPPTASPPVMVPSPQAQPMIGPPEAPSPVYQGLQIGGGLALPGQAPPPQVVTARPGDIVLPPQPGSALGARIQATGAGDAGIAPPQPPQAGTPPGNPQAPLYRPPSVQGAPGGGAPLLAVPRPTGGASGGSLPPDLISKDYAEQERLTREGADNRANGELGKAGLIEQRAAQRQGFADVNRLRQDKELSEERGQIDDIQALNDNAAKFRVDPNRWVANQSVFQKIALTLAAGLKGFSMGINKEGGENPVIAGIRQSISQDIALQQQDGERLAKKGQDAQNLYSLNLAATRNHEAAIAATQAQMLDIAADHIDAQTSVINSQTVRDQGAMAAQQIKMQADEYKLKTQMALAGASASQQADIRKRVAAVSLEIMKDPKFTGTPQDAQQLAIKNEMGLDLGRTPLFQSPEGGGNDDKAIAETGEAIQRKAAGGLGGVGSSLAPRGTEYGHQQENAESIRQSLIQLVMNKGGSREDAEKTVDAYPITSGTTFARMQNLTMARQAVNAYVAPKRKEKNLGQ